MFAVGQSCWSHPRVESLFMKRWPCREQFVLQKSSVYGVKRDFIVSSLIMVVRNEETRPVLACILLIVHTVGIFGQSPTTAGQRHLSACQETQKSLWVLVGASFWHMRKIIVKERE